MPNELAICSRLSSASGSIRRMALLKLDLITREDASPLLGRYEGDAARPQLGGVLATIVPADKKIVHGMADAVLAPCSP